MYSHILIATDGSDVGQKGVDHGLALAKALGARVLVLTVSEPFPASVSALAYAPSEAMLDDFESGQAKAASETLAAIKAEAGQAGVTAETMYVADAQPAEAILAAAQSHQCDLIVMGSHGRRGLGRLVLGSKAYEVVSHGHIPVLVVR